MELPIIREKQLLELLGISKAALYHLRKERGLPYVGLTRTERIYPIEKFLQWINRNCANPEPGEDESN